MGQINFVDLIFGNAKLTFFELANFETVDWNPQWHNHVNYEFHFSFGATQQYKFADRKIELNPGELLIIPPAVEHESVSTQHPKKDFITLSLYLEKLDASDGIYENFISALRGNALKPIKIPENLKESLFLLDNVELYETTLGMCRLKAAASQVVFSLFKRIMTDKVIKKEEPPRKILMDVMILSKDATLEKIALATNYSTRQLSRIIKEQYGMTFSQIRRRMSCGGQKKE